MPPTRFEPAIPAGERPQTHVLARGHWDRPSSVYSLDKLVYISGSQSVVHGSQGIRDQFPGDPWIQLCNGYFEVDLFL